ncbi:MAG: DUF1294 domain-containing protein [Bacteroidales bacterium]|nr:DUF1294 domain-containing protein [Bacteroidales bacterium]
MKAIFILILLYLCLVNVITFFMYFVDKRRSKSKKTSKRRISEANLLFWAFIGGSLGAGLSMRFFRHKTKHRKFTVLVPLFFFVHIILLILLFFRLFRLMP